MNQLKYHDPYSGQAEWNDNCPKCPHCGHEWDCDEFPAGDDSELETACPACEKPLLLHATMNFTIRACPAIEEETA